MMETVDYNQTRLEVYVRHLQDQGRRPTESELGLLRDLGSSIGMLDTAEIEKTLDSAKKTLTIYRIGEGPVVIPLRDFFLPVVERAQLEVFTHFFQQPYLRRDISLDEIRKFGESEEVNAADATYVLKNRFERVGARDLLVPNGKKFTIPLDEVTYTSEVPDSILDKGAFCMSKRAPVSRWLSAHVEVVNGKRVPVFT